MQPWPAISELAGQGSQVQLTELFSLTPLYVSYRCRLWCTELITDAGPMEVSSLESVVLHPAGMLQQWSLPGRHTERLVLLTHAAQTVYLASRPSRATRWTHKSWVGHVQATLQAAAGKASCNNTVSYACNQKPGACDDSLASCSITV